MPATVAQEIERATREVFASMVGVEVVLEAPPYEPCHENRFNLVSSLKLSGSVHGTAHVRYTLPMATCITCRMLEVDPPLDSEAILDAVGEVANMIIGSVKSSLETRWGSIRIGTPTVDTVGGFAPDPVSRAVHFRWKREILSVSVAFQPALDQCEQSSGFDWPEA